MRDPPNGMMSDAADINIDHMSILLRVSFPFIKVNHVVDHALDNAGMPRIVRSISNVLEGG